MDQTQLAEQFASYLVNNQDKRGTEKYEQIAEGYRVLRRQMKANEPATTRGDALATGVDVLQRTSAGGVAGAADALGNAVPFLRGVTNPVENYFEGVRADNQQQIEDRNYARPDGLQGPITELRQGNPLRALRSTEYSLYEAGPSVLPGLAATVGGVVAAPLTGGSSTAATVGGLGMMGAGLGLTAAQTVGGIRDEKAEQGLDDTTTGADLAAGALASAVEVTPLGRVAAGARPLVGVAREAAQEAVQEGIQMGAVDAQGGEYTPVEYIDRLGEAALVGGTLAKGFNTIARIGEDGKAEMRPDNELSDATAQAKASVAERLNGYAEDGYNLQDVDPNSKFGVKQAVIQAKSDVNRDAISAVKDLKDYLKKYNTPTSTIVKIDDMLRQLKTDVKNIVTEQDIAWAENTLPAGPETTNFLNAARMSNVLTEIQAKGMLGGVTQWTGRLNPAAAFNQGFDFGRGLPAMVPAIASGGMSLPFQMGAYGVGRLADAVMRTRSAPANFVRDNLGGDTLPVMQGPTLAEVAQARQAAEQRAIESAKAKAEADKQIEKDRKETEKKAEKDRKEAEKVELRNQREAEKKAEKDQKDKEKEAKELAQAQAEAAANSQAYKNAVLGDGIRKVMLERMHAFESGGVNERPVETADLSKAEIRVLDAKIDEHLARLEEDFTAQGNETALAAVNQYRETIDGRGGAPKNAYFLYQGLPKAGKIRKKSKSDIGREQNEKLLADLKSGVAASGATTTDQMVLQDALDKLGRKLPKKAEGRVKKVNDILEAARGKLKNKSLADQFIAPYVREVEAQAGMDAAAARQKMGAKPEQSAATVINRAARKAARNRRPNRRR